MAGNINSVILQGRLTRDPELRYTPGGTAVCDLSLAVNRYYRDDNNERQEETLFAPVTVWQRQAENCSEYLEKGSQVIIEGRLKMDEWENDDGESRSQLKVVAQNVQFLGAGGGGGRPEQAEATASTQAQNSPAAGPGGNPDESDDEEFEDIPF